MRPLWGADVDTYIARPVRRVKGQERGRDAAARLKRLQSDAREAQRRVERMRPGIEQRHPA
jgi:hypothetical protein